MAPGSAVHIVVSRRVQGVGFRYFTREAASRRGLVGWVRNLPDGRVEVAAEGAEEDLLALVAEVKRGPGAGLVTECTVTWRPPGAGLTSFEVTF
ncbi:acylphosphatase [Candidatus Latescibacterota bacterium]